MNNFQRECLRVQLLELPYQLLSLLKSAVTLECVRIPIITPTGQLETAKNSQRSILFGISMLKLTHIISSQHISDHIFFTLEIMTE